MDKKTRIRLKEVMDHWKGPSNGLELEVRPWRFTFIVSAQDRLSLELERWRMELQGGWGDDGEFPKFAKWVENWSHVVGRLVGDMAIVEREPAENKILIRSVPGPYGLSPGMVYHEIWWVLSREIRRAHWLHWVVTESSRRQAATYVYPRGLLEDLIRATWEYWEEENTG